MHHNYNYLIEYKEVLKKVCYFIEGKDSAYVKNRISAGSGSDQEMKRRRTDSDENLFGHHSGSFEEDAGIPSRGDMNRILNLASLAGIINRTEIQHIKRLVFRASRGNALVYTVPIEKAIKEYSGEKVAKDVYIITFQEGEILREKLTRL